MHALRVKNWFNYNVLILHVLGLLPDFLRNWNRSLISMIHLVLHCFNSLLFHIGYIWTIERWFGVIFFLFLEVRSFRRADSIDNFLNCRLINSKCLFLGEYIYLHAVRLRAELYILFDLTAMAYIGQLSRCKLIGSITVLCKPTLSTSIPIGLSFSGLKNWFRFCNLILNERNLGLLNFKQIGYWFFWVIWSLHLTLNVISSCVLDHW